MKRIQYNFMFLLNCIKLFLSLNGETSQQNEITCTSYSKMFNANDSSMNGTCDTYVQYLAQKTSTSLRIIQEYFQPKIGRKIRIFSLGWKNNTLIKKKKRVYAVH